MFDTEHLIRTFTRKEKVVVVGDPSPDLITTLKALSEQDVNKDSGISYWLDKAVKELEGNRETINELRKEVSAHSWETAANNGWVK